MADLLEMVLNLILEVVCDGLEYWAGWRFYAPFLISVGIVIAAEWLDSGSSLAKLFSPAVMFAGVAVGAIWQFRKG